MPPVPAPRSPAHGFAPSADPAYAPGRSDWAEAGPGGRPYGPAPAGRAPVAQPAPVGGQRASAWEQQYGAAPTSPAPRAYGPDTLSFSMDPLTAPLATSPPSDEPSIYSQASSVWFTNADDDTQVTWTGLYSDDGWRAAAQSAAPKLGPDTGAGLPKRVPQSNLVPGSVTGPARTPRIARDARRLAAATAGYFRGWRRGKEVGGFAIGQRDRGAWEFNREQRARQGAARLS